MSQPTKNGARPISAKPSPLDNSFFSNHGDNVLGLPPSVAKWLSENNLEHRFVNAKQLASLGGYHKSGWQAIKIPADVYTSDFKFGGDPDGYFRRGDVILAAKTKDAADNHRAQLKARAAVQANYNETAAAEVKQMVKASGSKGKVHVGYDENE